MDITITDRAKEELVKATSEKEKPLRIYLAGYG